MTTMRCDHCHELTPPGPCVVCGRWRDPVALLDMPFKPDWKMWRLVMRTEVDAQPTQRVPDDHAGDDREK